MPHLKLILEFFFVFIKTTGLFVDLQIINLKEREGERERVYFYVNIFNLF